MDPWYKVVTPRKEVREGRSFSPDEFAIALEQVVSGDAPEDYRDPGQFFSRTCFTRALKEHTGMVLRRLAGKTENTAPVVTLVTQFGGGKTHTLATLYHLAQAGEDALELPGILELLVEEGVSSAPSAEVGVFVGNAWDPEEGRETPWIDLARQVAGDKGVAALGTAAKTTPPGTEALGRVFAAANAPVLLLFDEVLNFVNRHRGMADSFHAFIQNLTVAVTGTTHAAAVISLPRSQVEMTDWDQEWQQRITKVVRRVAQDLIANDESEISEVVRRRLFEDLGNVRARRKVAKTYADWCFERRHQLPPEWTQVDTATTETKAREFLKDRFEACYPFHPSTLSVFQRKWQVLSQFQQTRGTLAMLAQWISWAAAKHFQEARTEPLITLGSAPLDVPRFRDAMLGQLGETRLGAAIEADLAGPLAHAGVLDADHTGPLKEIHRRVGTAILFESSGGQVDKVAHLPELRFALGEPAIDTTTVDSSAIALEEKGFFLRKIGTDGFRIHHQATLKKVVSDRRASLDEETEIKPAVRKLVADEFSRGASLPVVRFPNESAAVDDRPRLMLVAMDPDTEWDEGDDVIDQIALWTKERGKSPRLYPGSLVWCVRKPGRALREKVEHWLAWQRVERELAEGVLGTEYDRADRAEVRTKVKDAQEAAEEEVWASYRFAVFADAKRENGLRSIDLGAGHSSSNETLCGRVVAALKSEALLNESIGAGYLDRHWPPALKGAGAWPLTSLRQSFLDGSLTRLIDADKVLREKIVSFVRDGAFGLGSGSREDGSYERLWFGEPIGIDEVVFDAGVFLLSKGKAEVLKSPEKSKEPQDSEDTPTPDPRTETTRDEPRPDNTTGKKAETLELRGTVPPEVWNRLGTKVLPKLRNGSELEVRIHLSVRVEAAVAESTEAELKQTLSDLQLEGRVVVERS